MKKNISNQDKQNSNSHLERWQSLLATSKMHYQDELDYIDHREQLYKGSRDIIDILPCTDGLPQISNQVRNIIAELIEAQVDPNIPAPKVTALRQKDKKQAKIIEDMLANELDRMPFERINDIQARTAPLQGSCFYGVEWDNTIATHNTVGDVWVEAIHPKQLIPQAGVYTDIEDMDYFFICIPQTKQYILRRYGVNVADLSESDPGLKSSQAENAAIAPDMVDQYIAYYRNEGGGVGIFSWVNDEVLLDLPDYWARKVSRCTSCGAPEPDEEINVDLYADSDKRSIEPANSIDLLERINAPKPQAPKQAAAKKLCPHCGGKKFSTDELEYEELTEDIIKSDGSIIPAMTRVERPLYVVGEDGKEIEARNELGEVVSEEVLVPTRIPFYKPRLYPLVQQKNVSSFGQFMGESDADKVADHQNIINILSTKINEKLTKAGSYLGLPPDATIETTARELKIIRLKQPEWADMIHVYNVQADIGQDMSQLYNVYEQARQAIGVTDSYQGRRDPTATSGIARQFAAAQAAGRLESKRIMKNAAYADIFERIFKLKLAYADEPREVIAKGERGATAYETFNRYDFLEQDESGSWYWNDSFLFDTDATAALSGNRQAMWQEITGQLQSGALGPRDWETLALYWQTMEDLHYPNAANIKSYVQARLAEEVEADKQRQQSQRTQQAPAMAMPQAQARQQAQVNSGAAEQKLDPRLNQAFLNALLGDASLPDEQVKQQP